MAEKGEREEREYTERRMKREERKREREKNERERERERKRRRDNPREERKREREKNERGREREAIEGTRPSEFMLVVSMVPKARPPARLLLPSTHITCDA